MTTDLFRQSPKPEASIAWLESGDRLSRPEFERRYAAAPHIRKAELIEGIVYVASPLRFPYHAQPHSRLATCLETYAAFTPGTLSGIEPTVRLDLDNDVQPDIVLIRDRQVGGGVRVTEDGYLEGVPELVVEIAASSAAIDLGNKQQVYRRNGVAEYLVWQSFEQRLDWFHLVAGEYQPLVADKQNIIRSQVFPGLWLAVDALRNNQMMEVLQVLQQGIASEEHARFVERLTIDLS
ncbi:Uma2 family endonuclease [Roseofilum sp. Guam]|uniref:Uma2 family endonuclease n=1 Tax=Roseofilum sp. Guam TaxID=2821502 RepID=UPI001B0DB1EE|nr:Uma2 family endonuclease [Roseofilum sp. Guam]MBP0027067.1 Uma2 family endonuclease [Roseofilum sp. Guam]